jgi:hypothetical protein
MSQEKSFFDGKLGKSDRDSVATCEDDDDEFSDTGSVQSLPELCDLEEVVCSRYMLPKDIPKQEMLVCLHLTEFNEMCMELDEKIEAINEPISRFEKRLKKIENYEKYNANNSNTAASSSSRAQKRKKGKNKNIGLLSTPPTPLTDKEKGVQDGLLKELSVLLQKKSRIESYYSNILLKIIKSHPNPTKALLSIQNLLEHDKSTIHSLTLHLDHFAYIDSGLDEGSSCDESFSSSSSF